MARGGYYSVDSLGGVHVLLVGRDQEGRELVAAILRYCGALVTAVPTAGEALDVMRLIKANVLIVEVSPDDDGTDLLRRVRGLKPENGGMIPAIAVVGGPDRPESAEPIRAAGFAAVLAMPLDPWELCRLISTVVTSA